MTSLEYNEATKRNWPARNNKWSRIESPYVFISPFGTYQLNKVRLMLTLVSVVTLPNQGLTTKRGQSPDHK